MAGLDPDLAAIRAAVRRSLLPFAPCAYTPGHNPAPDAPPVLVACSGGPDSLALAVATRFVAPRMGLPAGLVTVDHGLQEGSAERAAQLASWAQGAGFAPVLVERVLVAGRPGGPEAAARYARYEAVTTAAQRVRAPVVLLGHTRDDQAETVLLALLRGAGGRGLAGMPAARTDPATGVTLLRPLLDVARTRTQAACAATGLEPWRDPHNSDPAFTRTKARQLLGEFAGRLGPAVVANLARTAQLAAADLEVIDELARAAYADAADADGALRVDALQPLPTAVRRAVLHRWVRGHGVPGSALGYRHLEAVDTLVTGWRGQRGISLPGGHQARRQGGRLRITPSANRRVTWTSGTSPTRGRGA